eukprot:351585-Chlamydomonas_euryale.AAC.14
MDVFRRIWQTAALGLPKHVDVTRRIWQTAALGLPKHVDVTRRNWQTAALGLPKDTDVSRRTWQTAAPGLPTGSRSERLGRRQHGHAHRVCTDAFVVCLGIRAPLRGVHHALIRRLVEERVWNQDHRGNGNQHLQAGKQRHTK